MAKESDGSRDLDVWRSCLGEINSLGRKELRISEIMKIVNEDIMSAGDRDSEISKETDGKASAETDIDFENCVIKGSAKIAKGKKIILAIDENQIEAFSIVYDVDLDPDSDALYFAKIGNAAREDVIEESVQIKFCYMPKHSIDNFIISEALAKRLRVDNGEDIKILGIDFQKTSEIDLDELYPTE